MTSVRSLQNPNVATRQVAFYSGVTDGAGNYSESFVPAFPAAPYPPPLVFVNISGGVAREGYEVTNDENGFSVSVTIPNALVVLGVSLLGLGTSPVVGRRVDVAVIGV